MSVPSAVLASASPRRRRLIGWLGIEVSHAAADTPEDLTAALAPPDLAASLAAEKAIAARAALGGEALVLAFDTVVVSDGSVLGKPADADDARRMLRSLAGRTHDVVTGVALLPAGVDVPDTFAVTTAVQMRALDAAAIESAIQKSDLNLTPVTDGKVVRVQLPPLTSERRLELVKVAKQIAEDGRVSARGARHEAIERVKKLEKDKKISEDDLKRAEKEVQDMTNVFVVKIDEVFAAKEKEVLEV